MPDELLDAIAEGHRALIGVYRACMDVTSCPTMREEYHDLIYIQERKLESLLAV